MPQPIKGSEVFIAEDILRIMRSVAATHEAVRQVTGDRSQLADMYSAGFMDGIRVVAEALGIRFQPGIGNTSIGVRWGE